MAHILFHRALLSKVEEAMSAEVERMIKGQYTDYAIYREQVGYLRGMKTVLDIAEDIEKGMT